MRTRTIGAVVVTLSAPWLLACAAGPRGFPVGDEPRPAWAQGRRCWIASAPQNPFRSLFRPGLVGNLSLWGRGIQPSDTTGLTLRFDPEGWPEWARVTRSSLPPERRRSLERLIEEAVVRSHSEEGGLRLLLVGGEIKHVLPSVICDPRIAQGLTGFDVTAHGKPVDRERARTVHRVPVHVWMAADASITRIEFDGLGVDPSLEEALLVLLQQSRRWPKVQDGIPMPSETRTVVRVPWNR